LFLFARHFGDPTLTGGLPWGLHDEGQQGMAGIVEGSEAPKEPEVSVAHQEAPEELEVRAAQHEGPEAQHEAGDQPPLTYRLDQF
jgi:hypothetical protein